MTEPQRVVYFIGPESKVYHTFRNCPALTRRSAYYPVSCGVPTDENIRWRLLCKLCAKHPEPERDALLGQHYALELPGGVRAIAEVVSISWDE